MVVNLERYRQSQWIIHQHEVLEY